MSKAPQFFVPAATSSEQAESVYADLAVLCHKSVPSMERRIYSITYTHNGEEWTATVGERLSGTKYRTTGSGSKRREVATLVSDPAIVLAIFPGEPYFVVTNHRLAGNIRSAWENPFMAGRPESVTHFALAEA